ncbi:MAG TPA: hypothetical protein PLI60_00475 [Anaerolineaceae bacterium]|nr:hypothetical protein [Anaerolineaceae bacterium]
MPENLPIIESIEDLEIFVNQVGACLVYPSREQQDITSLLASGSLAERRQCASHWAKELHLAKKAFLYPLNSQQEALVSWRNFTRAYPGQSNQVLNLDEDGLLEVIRRQGTGSLRALLQASGMPAGRINAALTGLQMKMLVTICGKATDEDGKSMDCFDLTDNWLPDEFGI